MKKNPLASVIIPAHNEEKDVGEAIESIQGQTYQNFEIIVSDDGSTDRTAELVAKYAKKDKRIKLKSYANGHSAAFARNRGIERSKGDFITLHDADQVADSKYLEALVKRFAANPELDGIANKVFAYPPRTFIARCIAAQRSVTWDTNQAQVVPIGPQSPIGLGTYSRKAIDKLKGFNEKIFYFEDTDLAQRFHAAGFKAVYEPAAIEYHKDPETFGETMRQSRWFGKGIGLRLKRYGEWRPLLVPTYCLVLLLAGLAALGLSALKFTGAYTGVTLGAVIGISFGLLLIPWLGYGVRLALKSGDPVHSFGFMELFVVRNVVKLVSALKAAGGA
jgi:glycosyltransferase involved in cell wall biosynthesis